MKIKEIEQRVGITRANIRYYEEEGLLDPVRNRENNYREYSDEDVRKLERIKVLRALGISIADIKLMSEGKLATNEVMEKRLEEISEEEKNLQEIGKVCVAIRQRNLSFEEINEELLEGKERLWEDQFRRIWKEDITKEILNSGQINRNLMMMLTGGYFISAVFSFLTGDFFLNYMGGTLFFEQWKWVVFAVIISVCCYVVQYFTSDIKILMAVFLIETLLLTPLLAGVYTGVYSMISMWEYEHHIIGAMHLTVFWMAIIVYVILLFLLSMKKENLFDKARYICGVSFGYTVIMTLISGLVCGVWIPAAAAFLILTLYIGLSWFHVHTDMPENGGSRYYAIVSACKIMNIAGAAQNMNGKTRGTTVFR